MIEGKEREIFLLLDSRAVLETFLVFNFLKLYK